MGPCRVYLSLSGQGVVCKEELAGPARGELRVKEFYQVPERREERAQWVGPTSLNKNPTSQ